MSNANSNDREEEHDDLLKALHRIGGSDESEAAAEESEETPETAAEENADGTPSPAASGFVGMLAKEGKGESLDASEPAEAKPAEGGETVPLKATTDQIYMAREIKPIAAPTPAGVPAVRARVKQAPGWYHAAVPVMYTLGALLILIGLWAIGAVIYMAVTKATSAEPGYPWIRTIVDEETDLASYTSGSRIMAWLMVTCLPVSLALGMMAGMMQRHIRATEAKSRKAEGNQNSNP